jgi:hypothetical protein
LQFEDRSKRIASPKSLSYVARPHTTPFLRK